MAWCDCCSSRAQRLMDVHWESVMQEVPLDLGLGNGTDLLWAEQKGGFHEQTEHVTHTNGPVTVRD